MHSSLVLASLLPLLASANPVPLQSRQTTPTPFGLIAARSASPIHLQSVNANGQRFWIGKETATLCPSDVGPDCPPGTSTELLAADGTASLNTQVPGGQLLYVLPTGALAFTQPHSANTNNGTTTGFTYTPPANPNGTFGFFGFSGLGATGFLACPDAESGAAPWQVFADVEGISDADVPGGSLGACLGFDALAPGDTASGGAPAAWEYT